MTAGEPTLDMRGITRTFPSPAGDVTALRGINITVPAGSFVAISGPSGSGKTTLLHLAALLDRPSSGSMRFDGREVSDLSEPELDALRRDHIGMVFQAFHLLPRRTVRDNVMFRFRYQHMAPADEASRCAEAMDWVGIGHLADREARWLSGGEMQRVAIARAVAGKPSLLLSDEPTGNLDRANTQAVMACFTRLHDAGLTILMVTHNEDLLSFATHRFHCLDGRLEERS